MSEEQRVLREVVLADGRVHEIAGRVLHVGTRGESGVEVWVQSNPLLVDRYVVLGTGDLVAPGWEHVGTAITPSGALVWHLFRVPS